MGWMTDRRRHERAPAPGYLCVRATAKVAAVTLWVLASPAMAQNWSLGGTLAETLLTDSNPRLESNPPDSTFGSRTSIAVKADNKTPTTAVGLTLGADLIRYFDSAVANDLDTIDWTAGVGAERTFARTTLAGRADYRQQAVQQSELGETGITQIDADRITKSARSSLEYELTPRDQVGTAVQFRDITFEGARSTNQLNPFWVADIAAQWKRALSPVQTGTLSIGALYFDADDRLDSKSQAYTVGGALEHRLTPRFTVQSGIGVGVALQDDSSRGSSTSEILNLSAGALYSLERVVLSASYAQTIEPTGFGRLEYRRALGASFLYRINTQTNFDVTATYVLNHPDLEISPFAEADRNYFAVEPKLSYQFLPNWSVETAYRLRYDDNGAREATSHAILASVKYAFTLLP